MLRQMVIAGEFDGEAGMSSTTELARELRTSQHTIQMAYELLAAEGLVSVGRGRKTVALARSPWHVLLEGRVPLDEAARTAAVAEVRERLASMKQPAVTEAEVQRGSFGVTLMLTVQSASLPGAVTAALAVARHVLVGLPVAAMDAREYPRF